MGLPAIRSWVRFRQQKTGSGVVGVSILARLITFYEHRLINKLSSPVFVFDAAVGRHVFGGEVREPI
jgi:hypothetical protein